MRKLVTTILALSALFCAAGACLSLQRVTSNSAEAVTVTDSIADSFGRIIMDIDSAVLETVADSIEECLCDPLSPGADAIDCVAFLEALAIHPKTPVPVAERARYRADALRKNLPGAPLTPFRVTVADGTEATVPDLLSGSTDSTIIVFYDPTCDHCTSLLQELAAEGRMNVVIVNLDMETPDERLALWPSEWIKATDAEGIEESGKYYFQTTPSVYMIDSDNVILKRR